MATIKWDAYRYLNITSRDSQSTTCAGYTKHGQRCRWDISGKNFSQIRSMLDDFETEVPAKAMPSLRSLAQLSLCEQFHQGSQATRKIEEWKIAIQDATEFTEKSEALKTKNRKLKELLSEEKSEKQELEQKVEEESSRRKQDLKLMRSLTSEVSSLKTKLKQAETEAGNSKDSALQISDIYEKREARRNDRISKMSEGWSNEKLELETRLQEEAEKSHSIRLENEKLQTSKRRLLNRVSKLNLHVETIIHAKSTLQLDLNQIKAERDLALLQKDEFEVQLAAGAETIDRIEGNLKEAEAASEILCEDEQRIHARELKNVNDAKALLEEANSSLVENVKTLNSLLLSEQGKVVELRQSLQAATDNLLPINSKLETVKEALSHKKDELEKLQVECVKAQNEFEEERRNFTVHQAASLSRIHELIQEVAHAKIHPFRTFFGILFEITISWVRSVFACFGRLRPRRLLDPLAAEENMQTS